MLLNKPTRMELRRGGGNGRCNAVGDDGNEVKDGESDGWAGDGADGKESSDSFGGGVVIGDGVGSWGIAMVVEGSGYDCEENEGGDITASPGDTTSGCG